ncbi:cytochrome P450 monooxygenase pc-3 [Ephemerocybe angulata]|uniref:Cytochrome P450 monooxygenase pc-3 n=1 Tax=Ephemerocybe angulata TaxID=980116 RepID=A0A8H6HTB1_9AGAR|nr:cytochrome P450 monooxygenase pc-3 [Tulosesus angulatus]
MPNLSPGVAALIRLAPYFAVPLVVVYGTNVGGYSLPWGCLMIAAIFATPCAYKITVYAQRWKDVGAAGALGAQAVPNIPESSLSIIQHAGKALRVGYPGTTRLFDEYFAKYGNIFGVRIFTDTRIFTIEPEHVKAILTTQFDVFDKGADIRWHMESMLGSGIFNADGDLWKFHRALTRPFFSRDRVSDLENFLSHTKAALNLAESHIAKGYAFDAQDLASRYTLDCSTQFLSGKDIQTLSAGLEHPSTSSQSTPAEYTTHPSNPFMKALTEGLWLSANRARLGPLWPLTEFRRDEVGLRRGVVDAYIEPILLEALAARKGEKDEDGDDETLLQSLCRQTQDIALIKDEIVNLLVAGRDSTASLITYSIYMLAENPNIAKRLQTEIIDRMGQKGQPTSVDIRELKYLRAFLDEVLRLYPPVPYGSREANRSTLWPPATPGDKPFYIPAKSRILFSPWYMHRRTDLWGPDAHTFDPDRFLDERLHKYLTPNPYIFVPFNAGPRTCIGQQFAYHMASCFLIKLLQRFTNFRLAREAQPEASRPPADWAHSQDPRKAQEKVSPAMHIVLYVKGGLWVKMDEAKQLDED